MGTNADLLEEALSNTIADFDMDVNHKKNMQMLISHITKIDKEDSMKALIEISKFINKMRDEDLKFLPMYGNSLVKGTAVRIGIAEYAWIKQTMISMSYATSKVNRYMRNYLRLSDNDKGKLAQIMEGYSNLEETIKTIDKLADVKIKPRKKYGLKKNKENKENKEDKEDKTVDLVEEESQNNSENI